jgi:hypothetical protein
MGLTVGLCRYLNLCWIDTVVHQMGRTVPYGYIFVLSVFDVFKILSDVFVFWGMWQVLGRLDHLDSRFERPEDPSSPSRKINESPTYAATSTIAILLLFLSIYHICLLFGLTFVWLQATDPRVVQHIAKARNGFEISYMALQFVGTLAMLDYALVFASSSDVHYYDSYKVGPYSFLRRYIAINIVNIVHRLPSCLPLAHLASDPSARL